MAGGGDLLLIAGVVIGWVFVGPIVEGPVNTIISKVIAGVPKGGSRKGGGGGGGAQHVGYAGFADTYVRYNPYLHGVYGSYDSASGQMTRMLGNYPR